VGRIWDAGPQKAPAPQRSADLWSARRRRRVVVLLCSTDLSAVRPQVAHGVGSHTGVGGEFRLRPDEDGKASADKPSPTSPRNVSVTVTHSEDAQIIRTWHGS
jgi:hypothetical protein